MRVAVEGMGSPREIAEEWTFDELAAAHRALWLKEQMTQMKWSRMIESIASGLKKGAKKG